MFWACYLLLRSDDIAIFARAPIKYFNLLFRRLTVSKVIFEYFEYSK